MTTGELTEHLRQS